MRVTIKDVAELAGVSVTTASRALNESGRMTPDTRQRVRDAAAKLAYRPNSVARALVTQRSFTLGLMTNDTYGRFTLPIAAGLSAAMRDRGVSVFLASCRDDVDDTRQTLQAFEEKRVDGLVIANRRTDRTLPLDHETTGVPTVYVMSGCPANAVGFVPDDTGGAVLATQHLIELGRKRIAHVTGPEDFEAARFRANGWQTALMTAGLAPWGDAVFGKWSEQHGYDWALATFDDWKGSVLPDAVFCGNDQIARGIVDALSRLGINVPDDVAVVGFDNWEIFAVATRPPLTSIDMNLEDLGRRAGLAILDMIDGKLVPPGITRAPTRLVVRDTCGFNRQH